MTNREIMEQTEQLEGFEENSALLFEYTWICERLEKGVEDEDYRKDLFSDKIKLRYEILRRMGGNK